jgi:tetratricopeptide (TPR) repeat protein
MTVFFRAPREGDREVFAASAYTAQSDELIEWFEDAVRTDHPLLVDFVQTDSAARLAAIGNLYERLAAHPQFGGGWPKRVAMNHPVPRLEAPRMGPSARVYWFAICCTGDVCAEQAQLAEQLGQLYKLPEPPAWIDDLSFGGFQAALHPHRFESEGDRTDHTVAVFGHPLGGATSALRAVTRSLDRVVHDDPLLGDGGALEIDGPRVRARALVTAGLIERLAEVAPFVLVLDEAQRATPFAVQLVDLLLRGPARGLVVLAGPELVEGRDPRDREWLLTQGKMHLAPNVARAASAIAVASGGSMFSHAQFDAAVRAVSSIDPRIARDELTCGGWIRPLTAAVCAFASSEHHEMLRIQALRLLGDRAVEELPAHVGANLPRAQFDEPLTTLAQLSAAATFDPTSDDAWECALLLAAWGELPRAIAMAEKTRPTNERIAILECWRRGAGFAATEHRASHDAFHALVLGASSATPRRTALAYLRRALDALSPDDTEHETTTELAIRLALFRALLSHGDVRSARHALGRGPLRYLSSGSQAAIDNLAQLEDRDELVARSVRVTENLFAVTALRDLTGHSAAFGLACVERLELLESIGRLDDAADALYLAETASEILSRYRQIAPHDAWNARLWLAWVRLRVRGDLSAIGELEQLVEEIRNADPANAPRVLMAEQWLARSRGNHLDAARGVEELDALIPRAVAELDGDAPEALDLYQWRGELLAQAGRYEQSVEALTAILQRRLEISTADDETVLVTKLRLACSIADAGEPASALPLFDDVVGRRERIDAPEAPRLIAARHARSVCFKKLGRYHEAIGDLDRVIDARTRTFGASDHVAMAARSDRAFCLMLCERWADAINELEQLVVARSQTLPSDHIDLLNWRQQRVLALLGAGRTQEAFDEIDHILQTASGSYPSDHPLIAGLYQLAVYLRDASAQTG